MDDGPTDELRLSYLPRILILPQGPTPRLFCFFALRLMANPFVHQSISHF